MSTTATDSTPPPLGVVHVIAASLRADIPEDVAAATLDRARGLREAPGARAVVVARSGPSIVVATWLAGRADLEPFAASRPHMEFVMRGLAPSITGMWSAGVESPTPPPEDAPGLLWAFAVRSSDTVFEWQVRDVLGSLADLPARVAAGPTFEERDRYRAGGIACVGAAERDAFLDALARARQDWGDMAQHVVEASAEVIR